MSIRDLRALTSALDEGRCGTVRPHLLDLVQGQLQTVRQQIAELQLLQQQLGQVEQQLLTSLPVASDKDCQCLEFDAAPPQEVLPQRSTPTLGEESMHTPRSIETLTILPTTSGCHDEHCGCGCGCAVVELSVPSAMAEQPSVVGCDRDVTEQPRG